MEKYQKNLISPIGEWKEVLVREFFQQEEREKEPSLLTLEGLVWPKKAGTPP